MPLNKPALAAAFKDAFKKSKEEMWEADQVAEALADAIDAFVRNGDVGGITTEVRDMTNTNVIGHGAQQGSVHIS
jgi:hypothetical protein